jgi:group II intron reverse transcriptase/maturase
VASPANLAEALLHVASNKGAPGPDGQSVEEVVADARRLQPRLRDALLSGNYIPGDVRRKWIPKPGGGKRDLGIPNVVDRWVQQAIRQVLEPIFDPDFHPSSHGFRPNRGAETALAEARRNVTEGYAWIASVDLSKFFDRVNHQRLLARLSHKVGDGRLLGLIHRMLKAKVVLPDGTRVTTEEGTPQGGPLSPLLSNVVLDELDWELERRGLRFVRYADDINIFVRSERSGHRVMDSTTRYLTRRMRLQVNEKKSHVTRPEDLHILGFSLHRHRNGEVGIRLSKRSKERLDARLREMTPRNWGCSLDACFEALNTYLRGWSGFFRICTLDGAAEFGRFDAHTRRRVRAIILKQKKRVRTLLRDLLRRDVPWRAAIRVAFSRRGHWPRSRWYGLHRAYPNAWFHERLVSLWREWHRLNPPRTVSGQGLLFDPEIPT